MNRDERRAQIIREAGRLVSEGGITALTIGALEKRVPFTRGAITHHFRNKREIVLAVLQDAVMQIDAPVTAGALVDAPWPELVRTVLQTKVSGFLEHPEASWILIAFWGQVRSDPEAAEQAGALFERYRTEATAMVMMAMQEQVVRADLSAHELGTLLVGTVIGIVVQALLSPGAVDVSGCVETATQSIVGYCSPTS